MFFFFHKFLVHIKYIATFTSFLFLLSHIYCFASSWACSKLKESAKLEISPLDRKPEIALGVVSIIAKTISNILFSAAAELNFCFCFIFLYLFS